MTFSLNILTVSTYPFEEPLHGGQHRIANIVRELVEDGHRVNSIGVLGSEGYPPTPGFEPYPGLNPLTAYIENPFLMDDWAIGKLFANDPNYYSALARHATDHYDLIFVEQPWLFDFARKLAQQQSGSKPTLVYGSQNIEGRLKHSILNTYLDADTAKQGAALVEATEREAIKFADLVVCVSESDRDWIATLTQKDVIIACNGVVDRLVDLAGIAEANRYSGGHKFALYCASAHPPNINGFRHYFGQGLGALSPFDRLVIAGGAGPVIAHAPWFRRAGNLEDTCIPTGPVPETCLSGLLLTAHCIILPLSEGEGTNLKTAEALWAGKHIVGTTVAFRGFEEFADAPGVRIADNPADFVAALRDAMSAPPLRLDENEIACRKSVLWTRRLAPLVGHFRAHAEAYRSSKNAEALPV